MLALLSACGGLPQPFFGNPGVDGARLAQPPPSRLAVLTPAQSLLTDEGARAWAAAVADALLEQEVPASAGRAIRGPEWSLLLAAELRNNEVVPSYTVQNPAGEPQGISEGAAVSPADWAGGNPKVLKAAATQAAPGIASLLARIEAARRQSDPTSLQNRPARVFLGAVTGAPGDGGRSLPAQMKIKMEKNGLVVQDTPKDADFEVNGEIVTAPGANGTVRVELQWIVRDAKNERGRIVQINEVDRRAITPYWGDTAVAVAEEAAGGVRDVIINSGGGRSAK
jgi:hypothetical protein